MMMPAAKPSPGAGDDDRPRTPRDASRRFGEIAVEYGRALQEAQASGARQAEEAARAWWSAAREAHDDARRSVEESWRAYVDAARRAAVDPERRREADAAYRSYVSAARKAWDDAARRSEEVTNTYTEALRSVRESTYRAGVEAYRTHLKSLQAAWRRLDVDGIVDSITEDGSSAPED
jgi:membrane protein involved in colicin uptake